MDIMWGGLSQCTRYRSGLVPGEARAPFPVFAQRPLVDEPRAGRTGFAASLPEEPWREFKMTPV